MPKDSSKPYLIRRPVQVAALASPVRQEIVDALDNAGPSTIARIAELLGRRPDTLYYHIQSLERVGLLVRSGKARAGRRFSAVYDIPGRPLELSYAKPITNAAISRVIRIAIRLAARDFAAAFDSGLAVTSGPRRNLWGARGKGWINASDLARANTLIKQLMSLVRKGRPSPHAHPQTFTFVFAPVCSKSSSPLRNAKLRLTNQRDSSQADSKQPASVPRTSRSGVAARTHTERKTP